MADLHTNIESLKQACQNPRAKNIFIFTDFIWQRVKRLSAALNHIHLKSSCMPAV